MSALFLFGGGWREAAYVRTYHEFVTAATPAGEPVRIALVIAGEAGLDAAQAEAKYRAPFNALGLDKSEVVVRLVSRERPLAAADLQEMAATGVFVAGGLVPAFHAALCGDRGWWEHVRAQGLPYAGFSAGAMIVPEQAIVGGWKQALTHMDVSIVNEQAGEQTEFLEVRAGLGGVPFAVEAHASQWGTLTRLIHAVRRGAVPCGWAIDEDTALRIEGDTLSVLGLGQAHRVRLRGETVQVDVFGPGTAKLRCDW